MGNPTPCYDVIVAGAGPSGSFLSFLLSKSGFRVLLLEKRRLPRYKPCAGCLSFRVSGILKGFPYTRVAKTVFVEIPGFGCKSYHFPEPLGFFVDRRLFDLFLVESAKKEGTYLKDGEALTSFRRDGDTYKVETTKGTYRAKWLVLANGARPCGRGVGLAVASEIRRKKMLAYDVKIKLLFDKGGYAWIFNKGEFISVGVGFFYKRHFRELVPFLLSFLRENAIDPPERLFFHPLPYFSPGLEKPLVKGVPAVGDRGFFMDAFLGEGIYYGLLSSRALSESLMENGGRDYESKVASLREELKSAFTVSRLLRSFPKLSNKLFWKTDKPYYFFANILRGKRSFRDFTKALTGAL